MSWSPADIPDLTGKRALVTGVTSGIGHDISLALARKGAEVVLAARSQGKLDATLGVLRDEVPGAQLEPVIIDLSELESVRRAAAQVSALGPLHLLINNAGVMATPYHRTTDGFELQMATNHFGPFALTGLLLPRLVESGDARVVSTSSQAHRLTRKAPLGDPRERRRGYSKWDSYSKSKLADLLFTFELDRRLREHGLPVKALAAHPGFSATGLLHTGRNTGRQGPATPVSRILAAAFQLLGQPSDLGALPTLMAATADLPGSTYVGPSDLFQTRGQPRLVGTRGLARDRTAQRRLWEISEEATGVRYP